MKHTHTHTHTKELRDLNLDSEYRRKHVVFVFLSLVYLGGLVLFIFETEFLYVTLNVIKLTM